MKEAQTPQTWTLRGQDLTLAAGQLIEYQEWREIRVARVEQVRDISVPPYSQVIDVRLYGPLAKRDGRRERIVQPDQVLRVLDAPPPPAPKPLTSLWSPRDSENPFRMACPTLTDEAWREIARWYPFSVRVFIQSDTAPWQEQARTHSWEQAKEAMTTLAQLHPDPSACWVVMKCELRGKQGREKPVLWYPGQSSVQMALGEAGLVKKPASAPLMCSDDSEG
jgi:hypothetical protein